MILPIQRHGYCKDSGCVICLEDATLLSKYLAEEIGADGIDWLARYRKWLDDRYIETETEHGWPSFEVYDPANVYAFVLSEKDGIDS